MNDSTMSSAPRNTEEQLVRHAEAFRRGKAVLIRTSSICLCISLAALFVTVVCGIIAICFVVSQ